MTRDFTSPTRAWLIVALLWFVGCFNYLDRVMITTMRGSIVAAIPMTDAQFGLFTSVFARVFFMADFLDEARLTDFGSVFRVKSTRRLKSIQPRTCRNILRECRLSRKPF